MEHPTCTWTCIHLPSALPQEDRMLHGSPQGASFTIPLEAVNTCICEIHVVDLHVHVHVHVCMHKKNRCCILDNVHVKRFSPKHVCVPVHVHVHVHVATLHFTGTVHEPHLFARQHYF